MIPSPLISGLFLQTKHFITDMTNILNTVYCMRPKENDHSVSENGFFSNFRWITVQHCYNTLAEPSKFHQTFKFLSQFMSLTALLCSITAATRNKFVLIQFLQWNSKKQDVMTQSNSTGSRHGPETAQKYIWVNERMRTDYHSLVHLSA